MLSEMSFSRAFPNLSRRFLRASALTFLLPLSDAATIETVQPVCPAFIREDFNPILGFHISVDASEGEVKWAGLDLGFAGSTRPQDISKFQIREGTADPSAKPGEVIAEDSRTAGEISLTFERSLAPGDHWFWISTILKDEASIDGRLDAAVFRAKIGGKEIAPATPSPEGSQRIGSAVRLPGDDASKCYRIPGMVRTKAGSLVAVYDVRYDNSRDLPANIDVGVSRSTDGGQTWEPMCIGIDMGNDPAFGNDGVGDPAVLADPKTGRIFITASWSHGKLGWNGSRPGMTPEETNQQVIVHSDDDGKTWSKPANITAQVKDPAWLLFLQGPGAGIVLKDGTLVFAAQYRAANDEEHHGKPYSTLMWSKDGGETWTAGSGVKIDTTEAQVAELADGSIMINCRDNRGKSRTIATTRDLGKTWTLHPSDRSALREPVCMASLLGWHDAKRGELLWFSNPDSITGRNSMTLKLSTDQGMTWPENNNRLYDSRGGFGYSCLAPVDDRHLGVIYEGSGSLYFLRFPVAE